jgi:hypothetical protein
MSYWDGIHRALRLGILSGAATSLLVFLQFHHDLDANDVPPVIVLTMSLVLLSLGVLGAASVKITGSFSQRLARLEFLMLLVSSICVVVAYQFFPEMNFTLGGRPAPSLLFLFRYAHVFLLPTLIATVVLTRWTQRLTETTSTLRSASDRS